MTPKLSALKRAAPKQPTRKLSSNIYVYSSNKNTEISLNNLLAINIVLQ